MDGLPRSYVERLQFGVPTGGLALGSTGSFVRLPSAFTLRYAAIQHTPSSTGVPLAAHLILYTNTDRDADDEWTTLAHGWIRSFSSDEGVRWSGELYINDPLRSSGTYCIGADMQNDSGSTVDAQMIVIYDVPGGRY